MALSPVRTRILDPLPFERLRDGVRAIGRVRLSLLDFRLGVRMLARYPLLTIVGSLALSFAIALGAAVSPSSH